MYKLKYYFAEIIVKLLLFFTPNWSTKKYEYKCLLNEIYDEEYTEITCKQKN